MRESSTGQADGQGPEDECNQDGMEMLVEAMNSRVSQNTQFSLYLNCLRRDFVLT